MSDIKTQGIIIARRDFSEGDRIFWILTQDLGLIQALAKGVRKILARLSGHLELGNQVQLQLYKGRTFYTIIEAQVEDSFFYLKDDLSRASLIYHFFELVKVFLPLEQRQTQIYHLLISCLKALGCQSQPAVKIYFELKFIIHLGFGPEFYKCAFCNQKLKPDSNFFSFPQGGILCQSCSSEDKMSIKISNQAIRLLRWLALEEIESLPSLAKIDARLIKETGRILNLYLEYLGEKRLNGLEFIRQVEKINQV
jgi:DNA repair protein RecO (recombination protein O)